MAPNTSYIEAATLPEVGAGVHATTSPGVSGGSYVRFDGEEPAVRATFEVGRTGLYSLLLRAGAEGGGLKRREVMFSLDGAALERAVISPEYQWNAGATHFRTVYVRALGELKAGRHQLELSLPGGLKLNEIIVTDTPAPFFADGWHQRGK
jgi:hypothetical protein